MSAQEHNHADHIGLQSQDEWESGQQQQGHYIVSGRCNTVSDTTRTHLICWRECNRAPSGRHPSRGVLRPMIFSIVTHLEPLNEKVEC